MTADTEDRDWQRLDKWLWCARVLRARADCADLVAQGSIRINRQPTGKPHAKLRVGDVLTIPVHGAVRVLQVVNLAGRRGPAADARRLYVDISPPDASRAEPCALRANPTDASPGDARDVSVTSCITVNSSAYRGA